jgi:hypothetical protein
MAITLKISANRPNMVTRSEIRLREPLVKHFQAAQGKYLFRPKFTLQ